VVEMRTGCLCLCLLSELVKGMDLRSKKSVADQAGDVSLLPGLLDICKEAYEMICQL
jgi:hypothetical protein